MVAVVLAIPFLGCLGPRLWLMFMFRNSVVVGRSPNEIIARFGEPSIATTHTKSIPREEWTTGSWRGMDAHARETLLSLDEFEFVYYRGPLADLYRVKFEHGVATGAEFRENNK